MLSHCLRRLPNFTPSMGLNASCFLVLKKTHHPGYHSPASSSHTHLYRHRKRWASVTDVGPTLFQHWFNTPCLLCLDITGLEQFWASVNVRQWWDTYGSLAIRLIKCPHILRIVPLPRTYTRRSANVRPVLQTVSEHIY